MSGALALLAGRPPSRQGQTCREAGTQSHGSGLEPDSRTTEGGVAFRPREHGGSPCKETMMPGKNARSAVTCVGLAFILSEVLLVTTPGTAGILDATWTAPITNTDGSPLTDLASYRLYYATAGSPCPGSSSVQVASPTSSPGPNLTMSFRLTGLTSGALY